MLNILVNTVYVMVILEHVENGGIEERFGFIYSIYCTVK